MMNILYKVGLAASTAVLSLGIVTGKPAQAASFTLDFAGQGQGSLSFTNTPLTGLTGVGEETISIDDLYNLAEDVNYQFSFPTNVYGLYDYDYGQEGAGNYGETFHFINGKLTGIDFTASFPIYFSSYGGSRAVEIDGEQILFVKNDRFTEFVNVNESGRGFDNCYTDSRDNPETEEIEEIGYCVFYRYEYNESHQIEDEGISYQITSLYRETRQYSNGEEIINLYPENFSGFTRYDQLPQITFTTLEAINPNEPVDPTAIDEPQPVTLLATGTAMAFAVILKKAKPRKGQ